MLQIYMGPYSLNLYTLALSEGLDIVARYATCLHRHLNIFIPRFLKIKSVNTELLNFKR